MVSYWLLQIVSNFKEIMDSLGKFITILTPLGLGYMLYLQVKLTKKADKIHEEMNGMKDALVASEKIVSKAEGKAEERNEQNERDIKNGKK